MANCREYLNFDPTEVPPWRDRLEGGTGVPCISRMIEDVCRYMQQEKELLKDKSKAVVTRIQKDLTLTYLLNVQKEEKVGVQDRGKTSEIMDTDDQDDLEALKAADTCFGFSSYEEYFQSNGATTTGTPPLVDLFTRHHSSGSSGSLNEEITTSYREMSSSVQLPKSEQETKNLYRALKKLLRELNNPELQLENTGDLYYQYYGLIDVEGCIQDVHKILMKGVMQQPGQFSDNIRMATFKGTEHTYPKFDNPERAFTAVLHLADKYNDMVNEIKARYKKRKNDLEGMKEFFKCASVLLLSFLTLHPFGDGNGRLARLLAAYCLSARSPFLTPIYNVFSSSEETDYVDALVASRQGLDLIDEVETDCDARIAAEKILHLKPSDLCAMLIESNWTMWRYYLIRLGSKDIQLYDWECRNQINFGSRCDRDTSDSIFRNAGIASFDGPKNENSDWTMECIR